MPCAMPCPMPCPMPHAMPHAMPCCHIFSFFFTTLPLPPSLPSPRSPALPCLSHRRLHFPAGRGAGACAVPAPRPVPCCPSRGRCSGAGAGLWDRGRTQAVGPSRTGAMAAAGLRFDGRVVLVTGAGGGEGFLHPRAVAELLGGSPGGAGSAQPPLPAALAGAPAATGPALRGTSGLFPRRRERGGAVCAGPGRAKAVQGSGPCLPLPSGAGPTPPPWEPLRTWGFRCSNTGGEQRRCALLSRGCPPPRAVLLS